MVLDHVLPERNSRERRAGTEEVVAARMPRSAFNPRLALSNRILRKARSRIELSTS
jgi:hypothetical protein